jgi:hypothetical protein
MSTDPLGYAEHTLGTTALRRSGNGVGWYLPGMSAGTWTILNFSWFSEFLQQVLSPPLLSKYLINHIVILSYVVFLWTAPLNNPQQKMSVKTVFIAWL